MKRLTKCHCFYSNSHFFHAYQKEVSLFLLLPVRLVTLFLNLFENNIVSTLCPYTSVTNIPKSVTSVFFLTRSSDTLVRGSSGCRDVETDTPLNDSEEKEGGILIGVTRSPRTTEIHRTREKTLEGTIPHYMQTN